MLNLANKFQNQPLTLFAKTRDSIRIVLMESFFI